ncbi:hypothetical protein PI126_g15922 [Phytophthora idaei]|nr:hypothetical protein PI126_g15922 [Phytophthora idaei]
MMTSRYSGVVTQLEEAATYRILGVWYMPRPTNLVVKNATNQIDDGECARHVYPSSVWFWGEINLIIGMGKVGETFTVQRLVYSCDVGNHLKCS